MGFDVTKNSAVLGAYSNWADSARFDTVAGRTADRRITDLSKATSGFARLFSKSAVSAARQEALNGFRDALTNAVGKGLATEVWKGIGADNVKGLTAEMVKAGLNMANRLVGRLTAKLLPGNAKMEGALISLSKADIKSNVKVGSVTPDMVRAHGKLEVMYAKADALLCMSPASQKEANQLSDEMTMLTAEVNNLLLVEGLDPRKTDDSYGKAFPARDPKMASIFTDRAHKEAVAKMEALVSRAAELKDMAPQLVDGKATLNGLAKHWQDSLTNAGAKLIAAAENAAPQPSPTVLDKLKTALGALEAKYAGDKMLAKVKSSKRDLCSKIQKELTACVKEAFGKRLPVGVSKLLGTALEEAHLETLNKAAWDTIEKSFGGFVGGKKVQLCSTITCGRKISEDAIGSGYDDGVNSYNCHTKSTNKAVNLATTELAVGKKTVFRGVRHGVHNAKCETKQSSELANRQRAQQTVAAAFVEYLKMYPKKAEAQGVISFNMTSISLQTPSALCHGEKEMVFAQKQAWDWVNRQNSFSVTVDGKQYTVKPKVTQFVYGVNYLAVGQSSGWSNVSRLNRDGLEGLDGLLTRAEAKAAICEAAGDRKTAAAIRTLRDQVKNIADKKSERHQGAEPYKMPARLAVLSYLMGDVPVWNCKSGKDRTGMLDVEAKFLATLIERGQTIPKPNEKLSPEQKQLLRTIMMQSGNLEMQGYNTGVQGYKLSGVDSIYARMAAGKSEQKVIKGGSGYVGS